jgi:hypothetical protein
LQGRNDPKLNQPSDEKFIEHKQFPTDLMSGGDSKNMATAPD